MYRVATGGVKLQVPADLVNEARIILSQSWSLEDDDGDIDDDLGDVVEVWKEPPANPARHDSGSRRRIFILVLVAPLIVWFSADSTASGEQRASAAKESRLGFRALILLQDARGSVAPRSPKTERSADRGAG